MVASDATSIGRTGGAFVLVFSAPTNNRVFKITCFQFWGGLANNYT
jgi:hypothetical protein